MRTHSLACRLTALVMSLLLAFSFGAVAAAEGSFTAGTYTGTSKGFGGDVTVTVEVSDSAIVSVEAVGESETDGIGTNALEMLPAAIVSAQSLKVDTVAGCTVTSEAVLAAAEDALRQSGASDEIIFAEPLASETAAEDEVIAAAKAAQCHEFISELPEGYHTVFGKNGVKLSGGQIQRIAIARAIVKNAPILVLDEATSFSDPENEHLIQQALSELIKGKTVIMIAHRLSTIRDADQILVVDQGRLVQSGTHEELMAQAGRYQDLWNNYTTALNWKFGAGREA